LHPPNGGCNIDHFAHNREKGRVGGEKETFEKP